MGAFKCVVVLDCDSPPQILIGQSLGGGIVKEIKEVQTELLKEAMIAAAKAQAVPDGFVLVPKKPTPKMIDAADNCAIAGKVTAHIIYKSMIEAQEQNGVNNEPN